MAKKLTGFADAMSEALMGRPAQESQPPMNPPVVEETTPKKEDSKTPMGTPSEAPSNTKPFVITANFFSFCCVFVKSS